jgi:hypothetical protein
MPTTRPIAKTTGEAYALIIPDEALPSGDPRYVSLDEARGTRNVAQDLLDRIVAQESIATEPRQYVRLLVSGHGGCGKTTELNRLKDLLTQANFAVVHFDIKEEFDVEKHDVSWSDVLLEIVWQMDEQLARSYSLQIPGDLFDTVAEWTARIVTKKTERVELETTLETEAGVEAGLPFFAKVKALVKGLAKTGSTTVKEIQQEAERRPATLVDAVSDIVANIQSSLHSHGRRGLVIIIDSLEKMPPRKLNGGLTSHNLLFIHNGNRLKTPPYHLVSTIPLALFNDANVPQVFSDRPVLMPMLRVRHCDGEEDKVVLRLMEEIIKRRVAPSVFAPGVVKQLALASGGHIRDFLSLVRDAAMGFGERVTKDDAKRAVASLINVYNLLIQQEFIASLDHVKDNATLPGGAHDGEFISRLLVLRYRNDEDWDALHPCVQAAPRYVRSPRAKKKEANP